MVYWIVPCLNNHGQGILKMYKTMESKKKRTIPWDAFLAQIPAAARIEIEASHKRGWAQRHSIKEGDGARDVPELQSFMIVNDTNSLFEAVQGVPGLFVRYVKDDTVRPGDWRNTRQGAALEWAFVGPDETILIGTGSEACVVVYYYERTTSFSDWNAKPDNGGSAMAMGPDVTPDQWVARHGIRGTK